MRKRRRLADKLTIIVCAVLVAVSAFFYAPMEVSAEESFTFYDSEVFLLNEKADSLDVDISDVFPSFSTVGLYGRVSEKKLGSIDFSEYFSLQDGKLYSCDLLTTFEISTNRSCFILPSDFILYFDASSYLVADNWDNLSQNTFFTDSSITRIYFTSDDCFADLFLSCIFYASSPGDISSNCNVNISFSNFTEISSSDTDQYNNGYNAGYSAGEQAGYGNGYSQGFADGEASVDNDEIYNQGFEAGKDSVDTQSYYDAGYQAGYQVAYSEGYDSGYDEGYQSAMDRIDGWGADTNDYPLLIDNASYTSRAFDITVKSSIPTQYIDYAERKVSASLNPNHTYRFDVLLTPTGYEDLFADTYFMEPDIFYFNVGGIKYRISTFDGAGVNSFYVPGDRVSNAFGFSWEPYLALYGETFDSATAYCYFDLSYQIYDMGPSGETQNHIANQTDSLTNGFNDSQGNSVNNDFSSGLNDFETAEDSLFATATTGLKDFTFFDIQSVPAMVTGMSFVGSIMSGWFSQAGGASGVGIVLSILFSIMLVAMVLGLYRWYQSKGGKD